MRRGSQKSRTLRRLHVRTPKRTVLAYAKRKHSRPHCANCGQILPGVATGRKNELMKLSKTERRPERPFAGMLCSKCMRVRIKAAIKN